MKDSSYGLFTSIDCLMQVKLPCLMHVALSIREQRFVNSPAEVSSSTGSLWQGQILLASPTTPSSFTSVMAQQFKVLRSLNVAGNCIWTQGGGPSVTSRIQCWQIIWKSHLSVISRVPFSSTARCQLQLIIRTHARRRTWLSQNFYSCS